MKVVGMIVEYNPFHNGHLYHLEYSKKVTGADYSVAIMSGHFLQRGEPALFDKWTRAQMAVENGVDLVIELPTLYSCQSAELFANGAVKILDKLNVVDFLCFGSESGNIEVLKMISRVLNEEPELYTTILKAELSKGILFPKARSKALYEYIRKEYYTDVDINELEDILLNPNNILGIEYIKSIFKHKSNIIPVTIERKSAHYNSIEFFDGICSASAIRESLKKVSDLECIKDYIPKPTYQIMKDIRQSGFNPLFVDDFYEFLIFNIISNTEGLSSIFEIKEGLENKIINNALKFDKYEDFLHSIKSKRYTLTSIKRVFNNIVLNINKDKVLKSKEDVENIYMRILAFNDNGRNLISKIKKNSDIDIINKLGRKKNINYILNQDIKATDIYNTLYYLRAGKKVKGSMDFYISPKYID